MAQQSSVIKNFVGRENILQQLKERFDDLNKGCGRVAFIAGEAGVGKTTLVNHFLNALLPLTESRENGLEPLIFILRASCRVGESSNPYGPFTELLDGFPKDELERIVRKLKDWARDLGPALVEGVVPYLGPLLSKFLQRLLGIKDQKFRALPASQMLQFSKLFEHLSEARPLILFIDDLHWADEASLDLIFNLAKNVNEKQILLIGTYRPHEIVQKPNGSAHPLSKVLLELQRYGLRYETLLEHFTQEELQSFLNRCYPDNRFPATFGTMLYKKTNGLPFYLDQVIRLLMDRGDIFLDSENKWSIKSLDRIPIPEGCLAVVEERVNNLDSNSRLVLLYASVLGEQFRSQILAKILDEKHRIVLRTLRDLETHHGLVRQIVNNEQSKLRPNWAFKHAFVHEALYNLESFRESLGADEKIELHSLAVDALESLFPDSLNELAGELAHHCEKSKRYDDAIKYRITVALRTYRAQSLIEAATHLSQGISDVEQLERNKVDLRDEIVLLLGQRYIYGEFMVLDAEEKVAQKLLQLFEQSGGNTVAGIEGNLGLAHIAEHRGDKNSAIGYIEKACSIALRSKTTHHMARVAGFIVGYNRRPNNCIPKRFKDYMDKTIELCHKENSPLSLSKSLFCRGAVAFLDGENNLALSRLRQAIKIAEDIEKDDAQIAEDYPFSTGYYSPAKFIPDCFEFIGNIYRDRAEWDDAIKLYNRVYKYKRAERNIAGMSGLLNVIAETQLKAGLIDDANRSFEQSWIIAQKSEILKLKAMVLSTGITIALEQEDNVQAQKRLNLFENVIRKWNPKWTWHKKQKTHAILNMRANNLNEAVHFLNLGLEAAKKEKDSNQIILYNLLLTELSLQSGDLDQALHIVNNALQLVRTGTREIWEKGEVYMTAARVNLRMNKINEAEKLIGLACDYFQNKKLQHKMILAQELQRQIKNI